MSPVRLPNVLKRLCTYRHIVKLFAPPGASRVTILVFEPHWGHLVRRRKYLLFTEITVYLGNSSLQQLLYRIVS